MIFKKNKKKKIDEPLKPVFPYSVSNNSAKSFEINDLEMRFFNSLYKKLTPSENESVNLQRLSNGTLNVFINTYYIGKVKLQGRKYYIQVLKGLYKNDSYYGDIDLIESHIDEWIKYLKWCSH